MLKGLFKNVPIKITAPILVAVPVLAAVIVISILAFVHGRSAANDLASQNVGQIHSRIEARINGLLSMTQRVNELTVQLVENEQLDIDHLRSWQGTLHENAQLFNEVSGIMYGSSEGEVVWMYRYPEEKYYDFGIKDEQTGTEVMQYSVADSGEIIGDARPLEFDPRERPWYKETVANPKPGWGSPYIWTYGSDEDPKRTLGIPYHAPHLDEEGTLAGVFQTELSLYDLSRFLESLSIGQNGMAFIIDHEGLLLSDSTGTDVADADENRISASKSNNPLLVKAAQAIEGKADGSSDESHKETLVIDGKNYLLEVSPFQHASGLQWMIGTLVPESDFLAEVEAGRRRSMWYGLIAVAAAVGLGVVLAMRMVKPFVGLVDDVRIIGGGELEHQVTIDDTPEFAQLSTEINSMTAGLREGVQMKHALELASEVQTSLLPNDQPELPGLDVYGHSTYCDETGGDYYDFLDVDALGHNRIALALGDVMGHGAAAAMLMATARGVVRSRSRMKGSLGELLTHMNQLLVEDTGGSRFMTMILMVIDVETKSGIWASAGHDPPIIYDPRTDEFTEWEGGGLPLAISEDEEYEEMEFSDVCSGQIFLLATDGLWEGQDKAGEQFGKDRLCDVIRAKKDESAEEIGESCRLALLDFLGECKNHDDVTFVLAKIK